MKFWVNQNSENRIFIQMMEQKKNQGKESSFEFMIVSVVAEIHFVHRFRFFGFPIFNLIFFVLFYSKGCCHILFVCNE